MQWEPRVQEILETLAQQHPTWVADDSGPQPTPRYRLNEKFAQQVAFEVGPQYGLKRADPGRPISSENLAMSTPQGRLFAWAWEDRHDGTVNHFPEAEDITGQVFVPVQPVNHLGVSPPHDSDNPSGEGSDDGSGLAPPGLMQLLEQIAADSKRQADETAAMRTEIVAAINKAREDIVKAIKAFRLW